MTHHHCEARGRQLDAQFREAVDQLLALEAGVGGPDAQPAPDDPYWEKRRMLEGRIWLTGRRRNGA